MKPVKPDEQDRLLGLLKKSKKRLKGFDGVHRVDVGYAFKRGRPTNQLAIRVHVHNKRPEAELKRSQILPAEIDGVPVDVLETNPEPHQVNRLINQNPFLPGVEIGNTSLNPKAGTLGAIVFDGDTLNPMGLSCNHVLFGRAGNTVNQPGSTLANDKVGTVVRGNAFYDAAVCLIDVPGKRPFTLNVADLPAPSTITGTKRVNLGMEVIKSGRTTAVTYGIVDGMDTVEFTVVPDPKKTPAGTQISMPGDSGSVWLERNSHRALGLHYAGETSGPDRAWAKHITNVLDKFNAFLFLGKFALSGIRIRQRARALGLTRPNSSCDLKITYPSGWVSGAKGLGAKKADANGWVRWEWTVGSDTLPHARKPGLAEFTLDGQVHVAQFQLKSPSL